jgi:hypothetical protein
MLRLEERVIKRKGKTNKFAVPILDLSVDMASIAAGNAAALAHPAGMASVTAIEAPTTQAALTPVPVDDEPPPSLPEQIAAVENPAPRRRRSNSGPALPATGMRPRTAEQVSGPGDPDKIEDQPGDRATVATSSTTRTPARGPGSAANPSAGTSRTTRTRKASTRTRRASAASDAPNQPPGDTPAWCRDLHVRASNLGLEDLQFRGVVAWVTDGRTTSTRDLKPREASQVNETMVDIEHGDLVVVERDGEWTVEVAAPPTEVA